MYTYFCLIYVAYVRMANIYIYVHYICTYIYIYIHLYIYIHIYRIKRPNSSSFSNGQKAGSDPFSGRGVSGLTKGARES
jgi:hypothetical protein